MWFILDALCIILEKLPKESLNVSLKLLPTLIYRVLIHLESSCHEVVLEIIDFRTNFSFNFQVRNTAQYLFPPRLSAQFCRDLCNMLEVVGVVWTGYRFL